MEAMFEKMNLMRSGFMSVSWWAYEFFKQSLGIDQMELYDSIDHCDGARTVYRNNLIEVV